MRGIAITFAVGLERNVIFTAWCRSRCGAGSRAVSWTGKLRGAGSRTGIFITSRTRAAAKEVHLCALHLKRVSALSVAIGPIFYAQASLDINRASFCQVL